MVLMMKSQVLDGDEIAMSLTAETKKTNRNSIEADVHLSFRVNGLDVGTLTGGELFMS
jgi:hypothetical protein